MTPLINPMQEQVCAHLCRIVYLRFPSEEGKVYEQIRADGLQDPAQPAFYERFAPLYEKVKEIYGKEYAQGVELLDDNCKKYFCIIYAWAYDSWRFAHPSDREFKELWEKRSEGELPCGARYIMDDISYHGGIFRILLPVGIESQVAYKELRQRQDVAGQSFVKIPKHITQNEKAER